MNEIHDNLNESFKAMDIKDSILAEGVKLKEVDDRFKLRLYISHENNTSSVSISLGDTFITDCVPSALTVVVEAVIKEYQTIKIKE